MKKIFIKSKDELELISLIGEALLLYEQVTIDISEFRLLEIIINGIDKDTLIELVQSEIINFTFQEEELVAMVNDETKDEKTFCAISNNEFYSVTEDKGQRKLEKQKFFSYEDKITEIIRPYFGTEIIESFHHASKKIELQFDNIIEVSFEDLNNPVIRKNIDVFVKDNFHEKNYVNNYNLLTESPRGMRYGYDKNNYKGVIDACKRQIVFNTNLRLAYLTKFGDISCEDFYSPFISNKLNQIFIKDKNEVRTDFLYQLFEIHDYLDIKEMIKKGVFTIKDILVLRKKHGRYLRKWIDELSVDKDISSKKFAKEYSKIILKSKSNVTMKSRLITFGLFRGLNALMPILGTFISAGYEFGVKEVTKEWQPKIFFNSLNKIEKNKS